MIVIDLSTDLAAGMVRYPSPYLPDVQLTAAATHEKEARSAQIVTFGTHVATHIDAPFHAIPGGKTVDQIKVSQLFGPARILRFPDRDKNTPIQLNELKALESLESYEKLIIDTGWARKHWGTRKYFTEGPYLSREASRFFADLFRLHLLGMDFPNVDAKEETVMGTPAPNHQILLGQDIVLLENLLRLEEVDDHFLLSAAPPRLKGGDGCPCRAMAVFPLSELSDWVKT